MKLPIRGRTLGLLAILVPLLALFVWVVLRAGPLAPVTVTVATVQSRAIQPALFGIGTVQARYTYKIGPTLPARVRTLNVHVGDAVKAGQLLGEMDPVDLDSRMQAQQAVLGRAEASVREAQARQAFARSQAERYRVLEQAQAVSRESLDTRRQELQIADAALTVSQQELARARADQQALVLGVIGFVVGKISATFAAPIFPKYVLLVPEDSIAGFFALMAICVLASGVAIRMALKVDPAEAIG